MNRSLVLLGAFALAAAQPAVTLGAPSGGLAPARPAASASHAAARGDSARAASVDLDDFKIPLHVDVQSKSSLQHFTLLDNPLAALPLYRRYGLQSMPGPMWYPALYGPACYASSSFSGVANQQQTTGFTLGSLLDGKSNLLSPPSYRSIGLAAANAPATVSSNAVTFQAGFYPTPCGVQSFTTP